MVKCALNITINPEGLTHVCIKYTWNTSSKMFSIFAKRIAVYKSLFRISNLTATLKHRIVFNTCTNGIFYLFLILENSTLLLLLRTCSLNTTFNCLYVQDIHCWQLNLESICTQIWCLTRLKCFQLLLIKIISNALLW